MSNPSKPDPLQALRERIDQLDEQIQNLITERARCVLEVAHVKQQNKADLTTDDKMLYYRPEREAQILHRVQQRNQGPLHSATMAQLFREIISACMALEQVMTVAYLGPEGTFTHSATRKHFGQAVRTRSLPAIDDVFREVEADSADYGVVPIENSTEGIVNQTLDCFIQSTLKICGEVYLPVHHQLLSKAAGLQQIERIYAHQQALAQCREWLDANLGQIERIAVASNGEAARLARKDSSCAAIASDTAATIYELSVLARNIEDDPQNTTRFLVIGKQTIKPSGRDKTSLLISAPNRPGLLHQLLEPITQQGLNMTRIESRPSRRGVWDYVFFIDLEGHQDDPAVAKALRELRQRADLCTVLGSYPIDSIRL